MRYYIGKQALRETLEDLVSEKDQDVLKVFREVMLYRSSARHTSTCEHLAIVKNVGRMLFMPRILYMSVLNLIFCACGLAIMPKASFYLPANVDGMIVIAFLYLFIALEILRILNTLKYTDMYRKYVLVDELLSRKIIRLVPKNQKLARTSKNPKAKVVD